MKASTPSSKPKTVVSSHSKNSKEKKKSDYMKSEAYQAALSLIAGNTQLSHYLHEDFSKITIALGVIRQEEVIARRQNKVSKIDSILSNISQIIPPGKIYQYLNSDPNSLNDISDIESLSSTSSFILSDIPDENEKDDQLNVIESLKKVQMSGKKNSFKLSTPTKFSTPSKSVQQSKFSTPSKISTPSQNQIPSKLPSGTKGSQKSKKQPQKLMY